MIDGAGATVSQKGSNDLLIADGGGDLHLFNISFAKALRTGIIVNVPASNIGEKKLSEEITLTVVPELTPGVS